MAFNMLRYIFCLSSWEFFIMGKMVNFVKYLLPIPNNYMIFILCLDNVHHIYWLTDVELSLYSKSKSHLIMLYDSFNAIDFSLLIFCWRLLHVHQKHQLIIFFFHSFFVFLCFLFVCFSFYNAYFLFLLFLLIPIS